MNKLALGIVLGGVVMGAGILVANKEPALQAALAINGLNARGEVIATCRHCKNSGKCRQVHPGRLHYNVWGVIKGRGTAPCTSAERGHGKYSCWKDPVDAMASWLNFMRTTPKQLKNGPKTLYELSKHYVTSDYDPIMKKRGNRAAWANGLAKIADVSPNHKFDPNDPADMVRLMRAIAIQENGCKGFPYSEAAITAAVEKVYGTIAQASEFSQITQDEVSSNMSWYNRATERGNVLWQSFSLPPQTSAPQSNAAPVVYDEYIPNGHIIIYYIEFVEFYPETVDYVSEVERSFILLST